MAGRKRRKPMRVGRPSPAAQAEFARKAVRRTYDFNPGTTIVPSKLHQDRPKHRANWRTED